MSFRILAGVAVLATAIACDKMDSPTAPADAASLALSASQGTQSQSHERQVIMSDACDPETFNAVLGPNSCVRNGGVTFDNFIAQLTRMERVPSWFFAPPNATPRVGDEFVVWNKGGETHTFTEVDDFGGGIVPSLNALMHLSTVAPECTTLAPEDFVRAGGTYREDISEAGLEKYQCCIHPWMRLEARIR
jgi:hypothetical protein